LRACCRRSGAAGAAELELNPFGLVAKAGGWHLIAAEADEPRLYRVSPFEGAEVCAEPARRPAALDLEAPWEPLRHRVESGGPGVEIALRAHSDQVELLLRICAAQLLEAAHREAESTLGGWTHLRLRLPAGPSR
jgi:predicted DNA-binding transcriptional regulator YafY